MTPLFFPGDLLCVRKSVFGSTHLGDVVICDLETNKQHNNYVVHRVVLAKDDYLVTQGDNNLKPDKQMVTKDTFVGLVTSFGRQKHVYSVKGGYIGLFYARIIHARNYIWFFIKRLGWRIYRLIHQSGMVAKVWQPAIIKIRVMTHEGPLIKYCHINRTIARWWPEIKKFDIVKPFDLVIPSPLQEEPSPTHAKLD